MEIKGVCRTGFDLAGTASRALNSLSAVCDLSRVTCRVRAHSRGTNPPHELTRDSCNLLSCSCTVCFCKILLGEHEMNGEHYSCWAVLYRWFYDSFNRSRLHFFLLTLPFSPTSSSLVSIVSEIYFSNFLRDFFNLFHRWRLNEACLRFNYICYFHEKTKEQGFS